MIKAINTRLLVTFVSQLKRQEIEHCLLKIDRLQKLTMEHPGQKSYGFQLKLVNERLKLLVQTSKELNSLEKEINNTF